jgi:hypothetical protein
MARKLRIRYPGAIYHVMNRGNHQERIFADDEDRQTFLGTLAEVCRKTGWHETVEWMAQRLRMRSRGYLAQVLGKRAGSPGDTVGQSMLDLQTVQSH